MKSKLWFYLCIVQTIIILSLVFTMSLPSVRIKEPKQVDLVKYLSQFDGKNNYVPDAGYIQDAETAAAVGSAIIDKMTGTSSKPFNPVVVQYDKENRLWRIEKGYLFRPGGYVIIEQDTGRIVLALLTKD